MLAKYFVRIIELYDIPKQTAEDAAALDWSKWTYDFNPDLFVVDGEEVLHIGLIGDPIQARDDQIAVFHERIQKPGAFWIQVVDEYDNELNSVFPLLDEILLLLRIEEVGVLYQFKHEGKEFPDVFPLSQEAARFLRGTSLLPQSKGETMFGIQLDNQDGIVSASSADLFRVMLAIGNFHKLHVFEFDPEWWTLLKEYLQDPERVH